MGVSYASVAEFRTNTGPKKGYAYAARRLSSADAAADTLTLEGHGFATGTPVQFVANLGGVLPAPLSSGVLYYALAIVGSSSLFQVSTAIGGSAINLSTAGSGSFSVVESIEPLLERLLEIASREIDDATLAHAVPQSAPYPARVVGWCCIIAEWHLAGHLGRLVRDDAVDMAYRATLDAMKRSQVGATLRDTVATPVLALTTRWGEPARAWKPSDGSLP